MIVQLHVVRDTAAGGASWFSALNPHVRVPAVVLLLGPMTPVPLAHCIVVLPQQAATVWIVRVQRWHGGIWLRAEC